VSNLLPSDCPLSLTYTIFDKTFGNSVAFANNIVYVDANTIKISTQGVIYVGTFTVEVVATLD
jgi:hypothetical protein